MSHPSVEGTYCGQAGTPDWDKEKRWDVGLGAYWWNTDRTILWINIPVEADPEVVPDAKNRFVTCPWQIRPNKNNGGHSWEWDGNVEKPTLTPSLHAVGIWHGWMRAGNLVGA